MANQPARVYINNYYRQPGETADNFSVTLPSQIINADTMSINSASIPLLCYTFAPEESILYFQAGSTAVKQVTLNTQKVYTTIEQVRVDLQALLVAQQAGITVTLDTTANDGRFTINYAGGINVIGISNKEYNWQGGSTYFNNCADRLGFTNGSNDPLLITPTATSFKGAGAVILLRTSCIYFGVDIINGDSYTSNSPAQAISNILFQLPVSNGAYGAVQSYFNNDYLLFQSTELPSVIYNIFVTIYDDKFNTLSLLPNAQITIEVSFKYKELNQKPAFSK